VRNGALLVVIAGATVLNGLFLDRLPLWRQSLFALLVIAAYLHGRHLPTRRDRLLLAVTAAPAAAWAVPAPSTGLGALTALAVFMVLPWLAGGFRRQQAELVRAGAQRVAQLERERAYVAEQVRLRERARIAADMHDSLGHELALIALRAGALELAPDLTERHRDAATKLRCSAITATDRLRHTIGLLRADTPDESLEALVARIQDAGLTVHLHRHDPRPASTHTDRAVHRVVQEALTNAARHAPGADADVRVEQVGDTLVVTVRNPITEPQRPPESGTGTGIAGLRDHVTLIGGTLRAGAENGVFTVTARLPTGRALA
jgi:signal transduction histidine kinase